MRQRVFTYITRGEQLLIFDYVDGSYSEPQIPGGTIKPDESPQQAALREAREETGLAQLEVVALLGSFERSLADIGRDESIVAWYFHLSTDETTPARWRHLETDPSESSVPIEFELYWVPLAALPKLGGIDTALLPELKDSLLRQAGASGPV